jgi:hypothetical protein
MTPPGTSSFDRKRRGLSPHLVATSALFALASCSGGGDDPSAPFRAVLMADTHVIGPQYECCTESPGIDNTSIIQTEQRLLMVRDTVNAMEPRPDMVFILGDVLHDAYHSHDSAYYESGETAFSVAAAILGGFEMPVHLVWGNHDYEVDCGEPDRSYSRDLSHQLFRTFFHADPYTVIDHKGWRFILANGMLGRSWDANDPQCDTFYASFGRDQLAWVEEKLAADMPTVMMAHHPLFLSRRAEAPGTSAPDLWSLVERHDNIRGTFVGHVHRWIDVSLIGTPREPEWVVAGTRYDVDNFWLVEFDPTAGTFEILDRDKAIPLGSCAQTWRYDGEPRLVEGAPETGDCVIGVE